MKKEDVKVGMRVSYPETPWREAGQGSIDKMKDPETGNLVPVFGEKDPNKVLVTVMGGSLMFSIEDLSPV